jgi:hypothetical protein
MAEAEAARLAPCTFRRAAVGACLAGRAEFTSARVIAAVPKPGTMTIRRPRPSFQDRSINESERSAGQAFKLFRA